MPCNVVLGIKGANIGKTFRTVPHMWQVLNRCQFSFLLILNRDEQLKICVGILCQQVYYYSSTISPVFWFYYL